MSKQLEKKALPMSGVVYDSFNDKVWNLEGFFEVLADYYEGNPETMAEDLVETLNTLLTNKLEDLHALQIQEATARLFLIRKAIKGIVTETDCQA